VAVILGHLIDSQLTNPMHTKYLNFMVLRNVYVSVYLVTYLVCRVHVCSVFDTHV